MNIEFAFRIYHKLQRRSRDFCETVIIERDKNADIDSNPTAITVKFISPNKREFTQKEKSELQPFCRVNNLGYYFTGKGEMVWYQGKLSVPGKGKNGKM